MHGGCFADALKRRICVLFGGGSETNAPCQTWPASRQAPERPASVRLVPRSPFPPELPQEFPYSAGGRASVGSLPHPAQQPPPCHSPSALPGLSFSSAA